MNNTATTDALFMQEATPSFSVYSVCKKYRIADQSIGSSRALHRRVGLYQFTTAIRKVKVIRNCMSPRDRRAELEEVMGWLTARTPTPECEERNRSTPLVSSSMQKNLATPQAKHEILPSNMDREIKQYESTNMPVRGELQAKVHPDVEDLVFLLVGNGAKTFWNAKREQTFDMPCCIPGCNSSVPNNADVITKINGGEFYSRESSSFMTL